MGRRIDETSPRVDARLPDGSRVNAIIEPLSLVGPVITVRKFSTRPYTVDDLVRFGTATPEMFEFLRACIEARLNLFVSGGTGSGKTTTLNVLSSLHPERRAHRHDRGRRRAPAPPGARHHARVAPAEPRGRGRDHDPQPAAQRDAHAARPDHRRRVPLGRGAGHAPGDDDGPRRLAVDRPRQQPAGHAPAARDDGPDDRLRDAAAGHPRADRLGRRPDRPHRPPQGRHPEDRQHHRGLRDRGRRDPHPGHLRVRADRRARGRQDRGRAPPTGIRPTFMAAVREATASSCRPASSASRPRTPKPDRVDGHQARWGRLEDARGARSRPCGRRSATAAPSTPAGWSTSRRSDRSIRRPARSCRASIKEQTRQCLPNLQAHARGAPAARSTRSSGRTGRSATRRSSMSSTRSGSAGSPAMRRSARGRSCRRSSAGPGSGSRSGSSRRPDHRYDRPNGVRPPDPRRAAHRRQRRRRQAGRRRHLGRSHRSHRRPVRRAGHRCRERHRRHRARRRAGLRRSPRSLGRLGAARRRARQPPAPGLHDPALGQLRLHVRPDGGRRAGDARRGPRAPRTRPGLDHLRRLPGRGRSAADGAERGPAGRARDRPLGGDGPRRPRADRGRARGDGPLRRGGAGRPARSACRAG